MAKRDRPTHTRRRRLSQRGQNLVEFALILPVFLVILMATVDFGWALRAYVTETNSAREGARIGITGVDSTTIKSKVTSTSAGLLTASNVTVTGAQGQSGSTVTVRVDYPYHYITPIGSLLHALTGGTLSNPLNMSSTTAMRIE